METVKLSLAVAVAWVLLPAMAARHPPPEFAQNLSARIEGEGGMTQCLNALFQLRSCTGEILLFFLNGESYLGPACCRAVRVIAGSCWPAMLTSIGYTAEEGDILRGYCYASVDGDSAQPPPGDSPAPSSLLADSAGAP